ncbi:hypothetical protein D3C71_1503610 [compost metagenome]
MPLGFKARNSGRRCSPAWISTLTRSCGTCSSARAQAMGEALDWGYQWKTIDMDKLRIGGECRGPMAADDGRTLKSIADSFRP